MTAPRLHALPAALEKLLPRHDRGLAFGIAALDQLLPLGLPRGHLSALDAPLGSGGTALMLSLAEHTLRAEESVAFVDAARSLAPQSAAHLSELGQFWVVRPRGTQSAWWCADILLRTGAFGLVIVDQCPALARRIGVRLQRLAKDRNCVVLVRPADKTARITMARETTAQGAMQYSPSIRLSVHPSASGFVPALPGGHAWPGMRTIRVTIDKGGAPRAAEVSLGVSLPHRLRPHWAVRDRRAGHRTTRRSAKHR